MSHLILMRLSVSIISVYLIGIGQFMLLNSGYRNNRLICVIGAGVDKMIHMMVCVCACV